MTPPPPLPRFHQKWFRACALGTAGFVGLHAIYSLPALPLPEWVTVLVGFFLFAELVAFFAPVVAAWAAVAVVAGLYLVRLALRRLRGRRREGSAESAGAQGWALSPRRHSLAWSAVFFGHLGLDINPYLTAVCASGVLLLLPQFWTRLGRLWAPLAGRYARAVALGLAGVWWLGADDLPLRLGVLVWAAVLLAATRGPGRVLSTRDRLVLVLLCIPPVQVFTVLVPAVIKTHDGREIGQGMAYSFCEVQRSHRLFAAVPRCSASRTDKCRRDSTVDELDARTLERVAEHRFFSDGYAGRLEQLFCTEDRVQVGMDYTVVDGRGLEQNLLEFRPDRPKEFTTNVLGDASGDGIAYDRRRGAIFYRSHPDQLIRRDLRTGHIERDLIQKSGNLAPIADIMFHEGRDSLFVCRTQGLVIELDPVTYTQRATYPMLNAWEFTIDEPLDRLYVAGSWGMEVIDLQSHRTVHRARIGFGGRRPAVDRRNDLIYVPSTAAGRLQVFDRRTLNAVGTIPLGVGVRFPYVSDEHGYVLATSEGAYYSWDAEDLARRLRGGDSAP